MEYATTPGQILFLAVAFLVFCAAAALWIYVGVRGQPVEDESTPELVKRAAYNALHWRPSPMSSEDSDRDGDRATVSPVVTTHTTAEQSIAKANNEYNGELSNNERQAFDTTAKSIAAMYQKGVITNLSKAICAAYGCTVQSASKPDSTYQMALKAVNKYLPKKDVPQFRMTPEQEAAREALGLNH